MDIDSFRKVLNICRACLIFSIFSALAYIFTFNAIFIIISWILNIVILFLTMSLGFYLRSFEKYQIYGIICDLIIIVMLILHLIQINMFNIWSISITSLFSITYITARLLWIYYTLSGLEKELKHVLSFGKSKYWEVEK